MKILKDFKSVICYRFNIGCASDFLDENVAFRQEGEAKVHKIEWDNYIINKMNHYHVIGLKHLLILPRHNAVGKQP